MQNILDAIQSESATPEDLIAWTDKYTAETAVA